MIRHLVKLIWNRKRASALVVVEIFASFLVLVAVATLALYVATNRNRPLGFRWDGVLSVLAVHPGQPRQLGEETTAAEEETAERLYREIAALPGVVAVGAAEVAPYQIGGSQNNFGLHGRKIESDVNDVTPGIRDALRLDLVAGRWFTAADRDLPYSPLVINQALAREAFGAGSPLGQVLLTPDPEDHQPEGRVVGVISDFRIRGELSGPGNYLFRLHRPGQPPARFLSCLFVRLRPGASAELERVVAERLRAVAPGWNFTVTPLSRERAGAFRRVLAPLAAAVLVAFFLLAMVGLGLLGVLWQNLLRRTKEIGLRRAAGATRASIHRQLVMEQLLLTTLGVLCGLVLVLQLPLFGVTGWLGPGVFAGGVVVALAAIYLLATLSALYPSLLAGRVEPALALRDE
ncbi:MAG TPA: ABC transporter permease [Thermoanaerobaculia bacterium]|nr:ABC transporter permease [Thermoanaerobaculia bacterium]